MNWADPIRQFTFRPRLLRHLKDYRREDFTADLGAGLTVAIIALPLAIAFGIASGVRPEQGLITAIVGGFLISLLGGSRLQIGGPAGAFVALLYAIAEKYGVANLLIATMMAGVLLFAMGALRLGSLIRFIPVTVVIGFTAGIAVIIALSQVRDFLGLQVERMPSNFFSQLGVIRDRVHTTNLYALAVGVSCLAAMALWPTSWRAETKVRKLTAKLPAPLAVLAVSSIVVYATGLPVETIGSRFGELPRGLPVPKFPAFDWATAQNLFAPTVSIALLGAIESLLCARVADDMTGDRHDPNQELMAQGVANFVVPFFGGVAATGTIARTVTNVKSGGRTPMAGMVHALALLVVVVAAAPLALHIPLPALAAILLWVAFNMGNWREFPKMQRYTLFYRVTMVTTFLLTVVFDVTVAVEVGLVLACLFFIYRMSKLTTIAPVPLPDAAATLADGRTVAAWRVFGSLFFGSATKVEDLLPHGQALPSVVILELHQVISLDNTALEALEHLHARLARAGSRLLLAGPNPQPLDQMRRAGFLERLGERSVFASLDEALATFPAA